MSDKPARLPSLRGPRDLTLGGVKKKTFAPKIPVRKERNKKDQGAKELQTDKRDTQRKVRPSRGRGRGRGRPEIIQSHSIFEAGPSSESTSKHGSGGGFSSSSNSATKDAIQKPTLRHEVVDEDFEKAKTEEALRHLEGGSSFIGDIENDETLLPTCLPMGLSSWPPMSNASKIKSEDTTSDFNCSKVFKDCMMEQDISSPKIIVFQLPDSLPAVSSAAELETKQESTVKYEAGVSVKKEYGVDSEKKDLRCTLEQLSEGQVGKLQIMKSGRVRLIMGGIVLDLHSGTPSSFFEELAAIQTNLDDQDSVGTLSVLGSVEHKIISSPDMESLIQQCKIGEVT